MEPPDSHFLSAAEGWLELGNPAEALGELDRLSAKGKVHPAALELRWQVHASKPDWDAAHLVAEQLVNRHPDVCAGWLHRSYALRRSTHGGLEKALESLRPAADLFPEEATVAYNLACYLTQLGKVDDGWEWFLRSIQISKDLAHMKSMALRDPDLEPLRDRVRQFLPGK